MPFLDPEDFLPTGLDIRALLIRRPSATFFMRAKGDALKADGIRDGDLLVVDRSVEPGSGDIAVVSEDGQLAIRKIGAERERQGCAEVWGTVTYSITSHGKR
ncbi:MAG: S24 family peptidase [Rhodospirillaceae bacterium]